MIPRQLAPEEPGRRPAHFGKLLTPEMEAFRAAVMQIYRKKEASKNTWNRAAQVIYMLADVGVKSPSQIDDAAIERFKKSQPKDNKAVTNFSVLRSCRAVCQHGVDLELIPSMPNFGYIPQVSELPKAKPTFRLSSVDFERMWKGLLEDAGSLEGHRLFAVYATAGLAGLRRDELLHLLKGDVDLVAGMISVRRRERSLWTKLASPIKISPKLREVLAHWFPMAGDEIVFPGPKGGYWDGPGANGYTRSTS